MSGFEYRYTCPLIDDAMGSVIDAADEYVPDACLDAYDRHIRPYFDEFRAINSDMRDEADDQIRKLESAVEDLEAEIVELKQQMGMLE